VYKKENIRFENLCQLQICRRYALTFFQICKSHFLKLRQIATIGSVTAH
jgi:hypothetical protein